MKKLVILLLLVSITLSGVGQSFEVLISTEEEERIIDLVETENGYLAIGFRTDFDHITVPHHGLIYEISSSGDTVLHEYHGSDTSFIFYKLIPNSTQSFYHVFGVMSVNSENTDKICYARLDHNLDLLWVKAVEVSNLSIIQCIAVVNMGNYFTIASRMKESHLSADALLYLLEMNQEGDSLDSKLFPEVGTDPTITDFGLSFSDNEYWVLGHGYGSPPESSLTLVRIDTSLVYRGMKVIPEFRTYPHGEFRIYKSDSLLLISKYLTVSPYSSETDIGISIIDTTFQNLNIETYGATDTTDYPAWFRSMDFIHFDTIYFAYTKNIVSSPFPWDTAWIGICQIDSLLNTRNEIFYGGDAYYEVWNILAASDGGCLVAALRYDYLTQNNEHDVIILKFAREDIITGIEHELDTPFKTGKVYPNPAHNSIYVSVIEDDLEFKILNTNGQLLRQIKLAKGTNLINVSAIPSGVHLYQIIGKGAMKQSGKWIKE